MKPKKTTELRMKLAPRTTLKCPHCGCGDTLRVYDGDTIPMNETMPEAASCRASLGAARPAHAVAGKVASLLPAWKVR
jgi:hypothetical protein